MTRPTLGSEETEAVATVLQSGQLVQGERVERFERAVAERCERRHAVAVSSGTAALSLAMRALDLGPGDEVICPDLSWPSPAHAILRVGAAPVLVDVDAAEWNVRGARCAAALSKATRAAVVIDQFGMPARIPEIERALPDVPLIVDAACSLGSHLRRRPCGNAGLIACLSFHPRKVVTTGEGGICLTDDDDIAEKLRTLRNHGQSDAGQFVVASENFRLTDVAAALGLVQMERLESIVEQRRGAAHGLRRSLGLLQFQEAPAGGESNYQTLGALLPSRFDARHRDTLIETVRAKGVQVGRLSYALHRVPTLRRAAQAARSEGRRFMVSDAVADRGLALPLYPGMTSEEQQHVIEAIGEALETLDP